MEVTKTFNQIFGKFNVGDKVRFSRKMKGDADYSETRIGIVKVASGSPFKEEALKNRWIYLVEWQLQLKASVFTNTRWHWGWELVKIWEVNKSNKTSL